MASELDMNCEDTSPEKEDFGDKTFKYVVSKNGKSKMTPVNYPHNVTKMSQFTVYDNENVNSLNKQPWSFKINPN